MNNPLAQSDISRNDMLLDWGSDILNTPYKNNVSQQLRLYWQTINQNQLSLLRNNDKEMQEFSNNESFQEQSLTSMKSLSELHISQMEHLNECIDSTIQNLDQRLTYINNAKFEKAKSKKNIFRFSLHQNYDENARAIGLQGMGELLDCPGRLWVTEFNRSLKEKAAYVIWRVRHALPLNIERPFYQSSSANASMALFNKKRIKFIQRFRKITNLEEKIQWVKDQVVKFKPILEKLREHEEALNNEIEGLNPFIYNFDSFKVEASTLEDFIIPDFIRGRDRQRRNKKANYQPITEQFFAQNFKNDTVRHQYEEVLEAYAILKAKRQETQKLIEHFAGAEADLTKNLATIQQERKKLEKIAQLANAAKAQEALILFQRYLASTQLKYTAEEINDIKSALNQALGISKIRFWSYSWNWLTFHLMYGLSALSGGRYFKYFYHMRKRVKANGYFTIVCQKMLQKNYLRTQYNPRVESVYTFLYGGARGNGFDESLLAYHAELLANNNDGENQANLQAVEKVIFILNQSPFFKLTEENDNIVFSDRKSIHRVVIDEELAGKLKVLENNLCTQAEEDYQQILYSFEKSLQNTWKNYLGHHILSYNGFSLKGLFARLRGAASRNTVDREIHQLIHLLRSLGCRKEVAHLYFYLRKQATSEEAISPEEKMANFFSVLKNTFEQFQQTDYNLDYAYNHRFTFHQLRNLTGFGRRMMDPALKDKLFLNDLKKHMNRIFEHYGYHERIERTVINGRPAYQWVDFENVNQAKSKERVGKKWWRVLADFITIGNTLGQAFFAALASFLHGNIALGCLILVASAVANFLLIVNSQRFAFIELFVKRTITQSMSLPKKIIFYCALGLCIISGIFVGILAGAGTVAAFTQMALPLTFVFLSAFTIGTFVAIGMGSLLFFTAGTLIQSYNTKKVWNYLHTHFFFKGFLDKSMGQKILYLLGWIINLIVLPLFFAMALLYTGATLGLGFDQTVKILHHIPKITTTAIYAVAATFVSLGIIMYFVFGQKNFLSLGKGLAEMPVKMINHLFNQFKARKKIALGHDPELKEALVEVTLEEDKAENKMWLPYEKVTIAHPQPLNQDDSMIEVVSNENDWQAIGGYEETWKNNPEQKFAPVLEWGFYIGVIFFLLPINAFGNGKSSAEGAPTLVDLIHDAGFPRLSDFIVGKLVAISCFIGSWGICGQAAHESLANTTPSIKKHPHLGEFLQFHDASENAEIVKSQNKVHYGASMFSNLTSIDKDSDFNESDFPTNSQVNGF